MLIKAYNYFRIPILLLFNLLLVFDAFNQDHLQSDDYQYHKHLSVGSFMETGRQLGFAGGIGFSGTTLSVHGLPGETPFMVKESTGRSGLTIRSDGNVYIDRDLIVYGQKRFVTLHPKDTNKIISYVALEGPEAGTYIRGTAELIDGQAIIEFPEHFKLTTSKDGITIQLTPLNTYMQLYVIEKSPERIIVNEVSGKSGQFDYFVNGVRLGYEDLEVISKK
jgi:hypothetical protein